MSKMTIPVAALLSIMLLASCDDREVLIEVPPEVLVPASKPPLPLPGASNKQIAAYLIEAEEWMDGAVGRIGTLAGILCALARQTCPDHV